MKTEQLGVITSINNQQGATITQGSFVSVNGTLFNSSEDFNLSLGLAIADTDNNEMMPVAVTGIALAKAGGVIGKGDDVTCDGSSTLKATLSEPPTTTQMQKVVGKALDAASASGEYIRVLLK